MKITHILTPVVSSILFASLNSCDYTTPSNYTAPPMPGVGSKATTSKSLSSSNRSLRPTVSFPARIAFARVKTTSGNTLYFDNNRDLETPEHAKIISSLPHISGVANIHSSYLESNHTSYAELRKAARRIGSTMLAVYQVNTSSRTTNGSTLLSVATLGAAPTNGHKATATISLIFMDAKTGYIYGIMEERATSGSLSTSWGNYDANKNAEHKANTKAFDKLIKRLPQFWPTVYSKR